MNRTVRRLAVGVLGGSIVALGLVMVVAPGPGLVLIPAGLGVLAMEFDAAKRIQRSLAERLFRLRQRWWSPKA
jgi:hypothetical protein